MKKFSHMIMLLFSASIFSSSLVLAEDQLQEKKQETIQEQEQLRKQVFGWELMTPEERLQHRQTMRNLKTEEEREAYRKEHHERMMERARERGVELPPYQPGRGMGGMGRGRNQ